MRHAIQLVTLLFALLLPQMLMAQQNAVQFNHLSIEDGLSQSTVQAILQDSRGYMWFGTQDGLNKYNGYDITVYKSDLEDTTSISDNDIRELYEDEDGRLWIGTQSRGLNLYDREKDRFIHYEAISEDWWTLTASSVWSILEDSNGIFWVGTSYGLNIMNRETGRVQRIYAEENNPETLSDNQITVLFEDSNNTLWVGTANGLNRYSREDSTFTRFLHGSGNRQDDNSYYIRAINEDDNGNLWVGTEESGLLQFNPETGDFRSFTYNENDPQSISDNSVFSILENQEGNLWIGTGNGGLNLLDLDDYTFSQFRHRPENPQSLSNDGINVIYRGEDEILWIGTFAGGVDYIDPDPSLFSHYKNEPVNPRSLSNNIVQSFYEDHNGNIWIGTDGGGLNRFYTETGEFEHYRHRPGQDNTISSDVILDINGTEKGLWLGTYGGGISLFNPESGRFTSYRHDPNDSQSLSSNYVFAIEEKNDGTLWFGTNLGGISILDPEAGTFRRYLANSNYPNSPETVGNNDIRSLLEDSNGDMWIGAYGGVLNRYDEEENQFYFYDINQNSELYASVVQDIYEDGQQRLWMATRGGGLKQFVRESHSFITYSEADSLPSNIVHAIEEDEAGFLWLSTNNGISRFDPETGNFSNYEIEDGIQGREFNPSSSLRDENGYIYFGGVNGFNRFHPENAVVDSLVPPVVLTDLHLFNRSVAVGEDSPLQNHINETDVLTLDHDASVITFEFAALDYSAQKGNQFAYMLEGFDQEWNYIGELRRATYTNLNPGEYIFRVKAANSDGVWDESGISLPIVITPPFWQTSWFMFLMVMVLAGIIYMVYWLRVRAIRKRNKLLASTIAERTAELQKANATKDKLFSIIAHDLINISTGLSGLSGLMKESLEQENIDEVKEYSGHLHNTISQFGTMLKNMLDWARSQTGKIQYDPINFHLADIVDEVIDQQESRAIYKNIKLMSSVDEDLEVNADPDMIMVILRNLVANALKFTDEGGKIEVAAEDIGESVKISVSDNGMGMSEEMVQKIFDYDESVTTLGTSNEKGTGLGISLCKDFIRRNKGILSANSEPGVGTTISFTLPVAQEMGAYSGDILTQAS